MKRGPKARPGTKWRTAAQERVYGRRLLEALRATAALGPRAVKEAADSALAFTARGRSRWSRAILLSPRRKARLLLSRRRARAAEAGGRLRGRLRVLRRLVPGCRKLSAGSLLEEAADYVAALEMQVKAMRALADALSAAPAAAAAAEPGSRGGV
ncbi:hypothetical protein MUK42_14097 [Musa troglodytarum]|uniref:BHLH domain-containing protein n=1 Tax=Musa troglodytarum TaxID=320322 RepID=A0A9E7LDT7_9LILI|nr:hypothetical protein MUK42_14097 [Musa troglodytarum]